MINEAVVCLDRRVVNPPAVLAGGVTTWTLPYPVTVNGAEGRVAVVCLETETELTVARPSPTTVSAVGDYTALTVCIGIAYNWRYVPTTIYYKNGSGQYERRAKVRLSYVRAYVSGTRALNATVTVPGRAQYTGMLRDSVPKEGQKLTLPVFAESTTVALEFSSDAPWPVRIGTMEWEGQYDPRTSTQVP